MTPQETREWEAFRERGSVWYVLTHGVAAWGGVMLVTMSAWDALWGDLTLARLGSNAVLWAIGGAVFGSVTWWMNERRYRRRAPASGGED